ncbi:oligopeptide ABC transporter permease [Dellaglioa sp. BT-FLS60]
MADKIDLPVDAFEPLDKNNTIDNEKIAAPSLTFVQDAWRRLKKNKGAFISLWVLVAIFILAFGSPILAPHSATKQNVEYTNLPPKIPGVDINGINGKLKTSSGDWYDAYKQNNIPKDKYFILGTDVFGRDLLSRIMYGTKISLIVALVAALVDLGVGVAYGILSGWRGGRVDTVMQRIIEIISSVPNLVVIVLMLLVFKPGLTSIILAIAVTGWTTMARLIRAQTLKLKDQEYILAARTLGESPVKIAVKHLLPNLSSVIIIQTMFTIPSAIFFEAFLSFIGIGISAPQASLGSLLNDGQKNFQFLPYQMWYPAIVLCIIMVAFNLLGDGLRDAFDPKTKE